MKFWNFTELCDASKTIDEVTNRKNSMELDGDPFYYAIIGNRVSIFHMLEGDPANHKLVRRSFWP